MEEWENKIDSLSRQSVNNKAENGTPKSQVWLFSIMINFSRLKFFRINGYQGSESYALYALLKQGGLNKKKIQLNLWNIFSILIFIELYLFD